jgi:hypothetical protein
MSPRRLFDRDSRVSISRLRLDEQLIHSGGELEVRGLVRDREDDVEIAGTAGVLAQADPIIQGRSRRGLADRCEVGSLYAEARKVDWDSLFSNLQLGPAASVANVQLVPEPDTAVVREDLRHPDNLQFGAVDRANLRGSYATTLDDPLVPICSIGRGEHVMYGEPSVLA